MYTRALAVLFAFTLLTCAGVAGAAPPAATITPVNVPGTAAFGATTLDLDRLHYIEQEFYVSGTANRYRITDPLGTAQVIDGA